ncbi:MAG: ribonuclease-3 [Bacteroidia bacterium]
MVALYYSLYNLFGRFRSYTPEEKRLAQAVKMITGKSAGNIHLYSLAMQHTSVAEEGVGGFRESNERLEYLGDAVLGSIVAEFLFKKFPYKDEGFLTDIRSRIVNRDALNNLALKIGLKELVKYDSKRKTALSHKSIYGDAMEAFIGAYYLDKGFKSCRKFIISKLLKRHFDMNEVLDNPTNFKSLVIEWAQKHDKLVRFEIMQKGTKHKSQFSAQVLVDDQEIAQGYGYSKKKAQQDAARKACEALGIE